MKLVISTQPIIPPTGLTRSYIFIAVQAACQFLRVITLLLFSISLTAFFIQADAKALEEEIVIEDSKLMKAITLAIDKQWEDAILYAKKSADQEYALAAVNALKIYYAPTQFKLSEIKQFFLTQPWLPVSAYVPVIEKSISFENKPEEIISWFEFKEPTTAYGKFLLLHANLRLENISLNDPEIKKTFRYYWRNAAIDLNAERHFIHNYKSHFTVNDLLKKIEILTWNKSFDQAEILARILPQQLQELPLTRLKIAKNPTSVRRILAKTTIVFKDDEFIKFIIIEQMLKKQEDQKALFALLRMQSITQPDKWWKLKHIAIRNALRDKSYKAAYQLTQEHNLTNPTNFTEAEWLAGWIGLRFLNEKDSPKKHFENVYNIAKLANTKSKAAYWLAQAYEQAGDSQEAANWYKVSSKYIGTFYGHLGFARTYGLEKIAYKNEEDVANDQEQISHASKLARLIYVLYKTQNKKLAMEIINHFPYEKVSSNGLKLTASYFNKRKLYPLTVEFSKTAVNKSASLIEEGYPRHLPIYSNNLPKGLYFAIIRQESKFDQDAISSAGAKGLMQIMPSTASRLASILGLPKNAYATNASANVKKGVLYVDQLYDQFKSCVLTIAAYNAGPGNVKKWIEKFGDPRKFKNYREVLDWIELIPYAETRNYVKKVLENFVIYDSLSSPKHNSSTLIHFLLN